jgi:general secretion pathway protein M
LAVLGLAGLVWLSATSLATRFSQLAAARDLLARMEAAGRPALASGEEGAPAVSGSPFLEGQTVTLAEAALQRRVGSAVTAAGGNVLSSQIEPQGETRKDYLTLVASCEIDQQGLQPLLYDLEAGMPFLFIDQLVLQAPQAVGGEEGGRLRLLVSVSGRWQGAK